MFIPETTSKIKKKKKKKINTSVYAVFGQKDLFSHFYMSRFYAKIEIST